MNHETSYRPEWASKLGGGEAPMAMKKMAKKKKKVAADMSAMKMKGMKGGKGK